MQKKTIIGIGLAVAMSATAAMAQITGPSSSQSPYVLPSIPGVTTKSIITVGDSVGGYKMVGIPDGLGAFNNAGSNSFSLMMNHELGGASGVVRAHGQTGSFVSRWTIDAGSLAVTAGRDHNTSSNDAYEWTGAAWSNAPSPQQQWNRYCSSDMALTSAYQYTDTTTNTIYGTSDRILLNGEENGNEGRAYAHIATGAEANTTWRLPSLGRTSWENALASPYSQRKTIVMGMDDSTPGATAHGNVLMYLGEKQTSGNTIDRAGLTNGNLYSLRAAGFQNENRASAPAPSHFDFVAHGDVRNTTGAAIDAQATSDSAANFLRPEDGAWDTRPGHENEYYFVTTDRFNDIPNGVAGRSRLWKLSYDDITNPLAGGTITNLLDGTEGQNMFDNMTIDSHGRILLQEDIGNADPLGKIWLYDIATGASSLTQIAAHDPGRFAVPAGPGFLTRDEESSGIIDAKDILGDGWFLLDVQAHYPNGTELVEGGQLLAMYVNPSITPEPGTLALLGVGLIAIVRRRRAA